ncbi:MAG: hypothetical protein E7448_06570 [Ruminococcaceae bacterium]|nr:hypothetical protein [Oscillospiraceae bacterium]
MTEKPTPEANLTEQDFYNQACAYFSYHAGQRTTMINYYIIVLGACLTIYGNFISTAPFACILIAAFMLIVSILFYNMDLRTKFDVKQSQSVICEFEQRYNVHLTHKKYALGVFSNEDLMYALYDDEFHNDTEFKSLRKLAIQLSRKPNSELQSAFDSKFDAFCGKHTEYHPDILKKSLTASKIPHLSASIRNLFFICMAASVLGIIVAAAIFVFSIL